MPAVISLAGRYGTRGLRVVSVTKHGEDDAERAEVASVAKQEGMTYPCFLDVGGSWSDRAGIGHVPAFFVLDRAGKLVYRHGGKLVQGTPEFEAVVQAIDRALAAPRAS